MFKFLNRLFRKKKKEITVPEVNPIPKRVQEHYDYLIAAGYEVVAVILQGSQNYNLDEYSKDYQSDVDTKAIIVPSLEDIILNRAPVSTTIVLDNQEHIDIKDIRVMCDNWRKMNISYIELLYSKYKVVNEKYRDLIDTLISGRKDLLAADRIKFVNGLCGMAYEKRKALCHPYPATIEKIEKYGYDGKQLSHCYRLHRLLRAYIWNWPLFDLGEELWVTGQARETMMEFKKQKYKKELLSAEEAVKIADMLVTACQQDKEMFKKYYNVASDRKNIAEAILVDFQTQVISRRLREELK